MFTKEEWEIIMTCLETVSVSGKHTEQHAAVKAKVRAAINNPAFVAPPIDSEMPIN